MLNINKIVNTFLLLVCFFSLVCADEDWKSPVDISKAYADTSSPQLAIDASGQALAVWSRFNGENFVVQASCFDGTTLSWTPTAQVPNLSDPAQNAFSPSIAMDPLGNALVVWTGFDGNNLVIQAVRYEAKTRFWSAPSDLVTLSAPGENAASQQVAMDLFGNAFVVWRRFNGSHFSIQASYYDVDTDSWTKPFEVEDLSQKERNASHPKLAVDLAGNAIVVWQDSLGKEVTIQASRFDRKQKRWSVPEQVTHLSEKDQTAIFRQVALDSVGNAIAVWEKFDGEFLTIQASHFNLHSLSWSPSKDITTLSSKGKNATNPRVLMDVKGNAFVVWEKFDKGYHVIQAARFARDTLSWTIPQDISILLEAGESFLSPQLGVDPLGNAVVVWRRFDELSSIVQAARFDGTELCWSDPVDLTSVSGKTLDAYSPQVALDPSGNAIVLWRRADGDRYVIQASRFDQKTLSWTDPLEVPDLSDDEDVSNPQPVLGDDGDLDSIVDGDTKEEIPTSIVKIRPPASVKGKQKKMRWLTGTMRYNVVTWKRSVSYGVVAYRVYRNGKLVVEVPRGSSLEYEDYYREKGKTDVYKVVAVGRDGRESPPRKVAI